MATAEVVSRPQERASRRRPFANFVKRLANFKGHSESQEKANAGKKATGHRQRKHPVQASGKSTVYPESGHLTVQQQASQPSVAAVASSQYEDRHSYSSLPDTFHDKHGSGHRSGAPTLATNPETIHSDAGQSKAATATTAGGAFSCIDGHRGGSTFSSPNQSEHSLATTLTTLQSTTLHHAPGAASGPNSPYHHNQQSQPMGSMFSHQFPSSSVPSGQATASAIPRHLTNSENIPSAYNPGTTGSVLADNASILTLASSSKRRRRSMDTDASVRALAPSSVWGGSRESLPLSVLSGNYGGLGGGEARSPAGTGGGGPMGSAASAERASVYSVSYRESMGVTSPVLASERNSYYAKQAIGAGAGAGAGSDAKSLRSIATNNVPRENPRPDGASDARSLLQSDARSLSNVDPSRNSLQHDVASLRSYHADTRHARNDSIPGSIGPGSGAITPSLLRQTSTGGGTMLSLSRRSSDWRPMDDELEARDDGRDGEDVEVGGEVRDGQTHGSSVHA